MSRERQVHPMRALFGVAGFVVGCFFVCTGCSGLEREAGQSFDEAKELRDQVMALDRRISEPDASLGEIRARIEAISDLAQDHAVTAARVDARIDQISEIAAEAKDSAAGLVSIVPGLQAVIPELTRKVETFATVVPMLQATATTFEARLADVPDAREIEMQLAAVSATATDAAAIGPSDVLPFAGLFGLLALARKREEEKQQQAPPAPIPGGTA